MEYYSAVKKEWNIAMGSNMNGPRDYHTKWSKSDRERQISYDIIYLWNLKGGYKWTHFYKRNRLTDIENKPTVPSEERRSEIKLEVGD